MDRLNLRNLKAEVHRTLLSKLDLEKLGRVGNDRAREATVRLIQASCIRRRTPRFATTIT